MLCVRIRLTLVLLMLRNSLARILKKNQKKLSLTLHCGDDSDSRQ